MIEIVEFWKVLDFSNPPFVHPADWPLIEKASRAPLMNHASFCTSPHFGMEYDTSLHLALLPVPYQGDLATADIFILLLNPGLGLGDYFTQDNSTHSNILKKIILQDLKAVEYPFLSLNPQLSWSGRFIWWERKLRRLLRNIADEHFDGDYTRTLKYMSGRLAAIELFPYHSKSFKDHRIARKLPSVLAAQNFVRSVLANKAREGSATIIAMRQIAAFGLPEHENIIQYSGAETRAAHLGPTSRAGQAILNRVRTSLR